MGFFKSMIKELKQEAEKAINKTTTEEQPEANSDPMYPPTRWEKSVIGLNGIVQQVSKIDPDGIDVLCFPGTYNEVDIYRNVKDTKSVEQLVTAKPPSGPCHMGKAMDTVFEEAFAKGFERPCSVLVLTAGRPDDHEQLAANISRAAMSLQKGSDLSVTFVQVGDDEWAETFLRHLDDNLTCTSASGESIDIVDTIKDEDIKRAVGETTQGAGFLGQGGAGALVGALAGAAVGAGGMYLYNHMKSKERTKGWNGTWKAMDGEKEMAVLTVVDDGAGLLTIEGWPDNGLSMGQYSKKEDGSYSIMHTEPGQDEYIYGTVEDEHNIHWSDGSRWEEVPPEGESWAMYAGAAAAGAAVSGAVGYLVQKKFFNNVANQVPCDYVIVMDRSHQMAVPDTGK